MLTAPAVVRELTNTHSLRPKLDDDRRQLLLPRESVSLLPQEIRDAIKEHRNHLLRNTIFLEAHLRFDAWMLGHAGVHREAYPYAAGVEGLGGNGSLARLNEVWCDPDATLDRFETTLSSYLSTGVKAFEAALEGAALRKAVAEPTNLQLPGTPTSRYDPPPAPQPTL